MRRGLAWSGWVWLGLAAYFGARHRSMQTAKSTSPKYDRDYDIIVY
ncbi:MAG: hypothetical protein PHR78_04215 [Eubacteriales bacterium]|nr:hypothetical protein [Eubacteriales bacterium]